MPLYITRNGTDLVIAQEGEGATGPCWGFDSDTGTPVFRRPDGGWVTGSGEPVSIFGGFNFTTGKDSALVAVL